MTLIDTGFIGHVPLVSACLARFGLDWSDIDQILLTHGHLDHVFNLAEMIRRTNAMVYAHPLDEAHVRQSYHYPGIRHICGLLEAAGRFILPYCRAAVCVRHIKGGDPLSCAGGIEVIHTPGHTRRHCSFLHRPSGILFSGDLFATGKLRTGLPWPGLNSCPEYFSSSMQKVIDPEPAGILANHCNRNSPVQQKYRFLDKFIRK